MEKHFQTRHSSSAKQATRSFSAQSVAPSGKHPPKEQPERAALLPLRKAFSLFANVRPGLLFPELLDASPLKIERIPDGIDIVCIRELTGGIYFGQPKTTVELEDGDILGTDTMVYKKSEIERIARVAITAARGRGKKSAQSTRPAFTETSVLWRKTVTELFAAEAPDIELSHMYVDNAAMQMARRPKPIRCSLHRKYVRRHPLGRNGCQFAGPRPASSASLRRQQQPLRQTFRSTSQQAAQPQTLRVKTWPIHARSDSLRSSSTPLFIWAR